MDKYLFTGFLPHTNGDTIIHVDDHIFRGNWLYWDKSGNIVKNLLPNNCNWDWLNENVANALGIIISKTIHTLLGYEIYPTTKRN